MVIHLKNFINLHVPDAKEIIGIDETVRQWKCDNNGATPIIVIEFAGFYRSMCKTPKNQLDILFGHHERSLNTTEAVLKRFQNLGVQMEFFCNGPSRFKAGLMDSVIKTGMQRYKQHETILKMISLECDPQIMLSKAKEEIFNNSSYFIAALLLVEKYGRVHKSFHNQIKRDILMYASKHNALAIISGSTDYILIAGKWKFWDLEMLDPVKFQIQQFNYTKLRDALHLNDMQLALMGVLIGKHFPRHLAIKFIRTLGHAKYSMKNIARFIKTNFRNNKMVSPDEIAKLICPNDIPSYTKIAEESLKLYTNCIDSEPIVEDELSIIVKQFHNSFVYEFLNDLQVPMQTLFLCNSIKNKFFDVMIQGYRRQMGIVLQHKNAELSRTIYCYKKSGIEIKSVCPLYPLLSVPPLLQLYHQIEGEDDLLETKLKLLCWIASFRLEYSLIEIIPKAYLCAVLVLVHMVEHQFITSEEADCILYSLQEYNLNRESIKLLTYPNSIGERPFKIVFLYDKFYEFMTYSMTTVGLSDLVMYNQLDGIHFHRQYDHFINMSEDKRIGLMKSVKDYRIY